MGERALLVEGDLRSSRRWFDAAYREAESAGDSTAMALASLGMGGLWVHERRSAAEGADVEARQRRAMSRLEPESPLALRLKARLVGEADYRDGGHARVLALLDEARRREDPVALAEVLSLAHHCMLGADLGAARLALADELLRAASRTRRPSDVLMGLTWRAVDMFLSGDPKAERSLAELRDALGNRNHLALGYVASALDVMLSIRAGRLREAESLAADCAKRGSSAGDADAQGWHSVQLLAIRWYQGRAAELAPSLTELVASPTLGAVDRASYAALSVAAAAAGERRRAASALARLRGGDFGELRRSSSWLAAMYGAVEAAYLLGDERACANAYERLKPFAALPMMASLAVACFGSTHHALGVASLTLGNPDTAVGHLRDAVRANHELGHWPAVVLSRHRLVEALVRRAAPGDRGQAEHERVLALEDARAFGMTLPDHAGTAECPTPAAPPPRPGGPPAVAQIRRQDRRWHIQFGAHSALVDDCVGIRYLATLVAHRGREIAAIDLAAGPAVPTGNGQAPRSGVRQPLLDDRARREYRERLAGLTAEIEEYEQMNDLGRAAKSRAERDWLVREIRSATGLNDRSHHFADDAERARIAVTKAIRRTLERIATEDPVIGAELETRVQTGMRCCFHG